MSDSDAARELDISAEAAESPRVGTIPPLALSKLTILYLATGGLYSVAWFLRTLRCLEEHVPDHGRPVRRALAFAGIPASIAVFQLVARMAVLPFGYVEGFRHLLQSPGWLFAAVVGWALFLAGVREFYLLTDSDIERYRVSLGGLIYVRHPRVESAWFALLWLCWMLPNPYRCIGLLSVLPLRGVQRALNNYLDVAAHHAEERRFTRVELLALAIGGTLMLWLLGGAVIRLVDMFEPTSVPGYNG